MSTARDRGILRITRALLHPERAVAAIEALRDCGDDAVVEGLVELLYAPPSARAASAAIGVLAKVESPLAVDGLRVALESAWASVRLAAIQALGGRAGCRDGLGRILREDTSWLVRRAALTALAEEPGRWEILAAADDPHWRVRHALVDVLFDWGRDADRRAEIERRLDGTDSRTWGVKAYLRHRWYGEEPPAAIVPVDPIASLAFWDWDPAVLGRNLERMSEAERRAALDHMPSLLGHDDARVRSVAVDALGRWGEAAHLAESLRVLDEPRREAVQSVHSLWRTIDLDRAASTGRRLLAQPAPTPAQIVWLLEQVDVSLPAAEAGATLVRLHSERASLPDKVRHAMARALARIGDEAALDRLRGLLADVDADVQVAAIVGLASHAASDSFRPLLASPHGRVRAAVVKALFASAQITADLVEDADPRVRIALAESVASRPGEARGWLERLQNDRHPHVRAAALTSERAAAIVADPGQETSWHVRARAALLAKVPLWKLEDGERWTPIAAKTEAARPLDVQPATFANLRRLGRRGLEACPLGVSGHYGLPVEGFARALEAGVNLLFWEPNYTTLTEFAQRLPADTRRRLCFVAGTFEADGAGVRKDAERALRALKIDRLALFLVFWTRSWGRISDDVRATLERLLAEGKVGDYGLSTHSRPLAVEAIESGWNPVMVRHSAAHPGAERHIFPAAERQGTDLLTFNNTCYGRLLEPRAGIEPPSAADCYRYCLEQPGVSAGWTAPATMAELEENLAALRDPSLPAARREHLLRAGAALYRSEVVFRQCLRER